MNAVEIEEAVSKLAEAAGSSPVTPAIFFE